MKGSREVCDEQELCFCSIHLRMFVQRRQLIQLGVPSSFIALCLDEGPGNPIRSPYVDYTKLYAVVSILIRCYDLSVKQQSSLEV